MRRAFSLRSVLFSLLGIFLMSGVAGYHDDVCRTGPLMIGSHLPCAAFVYLALVGVVWNGLAGRLSKRLALAPKELAVVLCATLAACFPPTSGCFRYALRMIVLPWYYLPGRPDWEAHGLLEMLPGNLFPAPGPQAASALAGSPEFTAYQTVYQGYFAGLAQGTHWVPLSELPLAAWLKPVLHWGPLVFLVALTCIALQLVVHRQWAHHEQLGYPVAQVMGSLCAREDGRPGVPDVFRSRLFWAAAIPVFLYYSINFLATKYPGRLPLISEILPNLRWWYVPLQETFPGIKHGGWYYNVLCGQAFFFTIVGSAFFVSTDIALSMGAAPLLLTLFGLGYYATTGSVIGGGRVESACAGATLGYTAILLYTGRTYFRAVLTAAFTRRTPATAVDPSAVLGARVAILGFVGTVVALRLMGLETTVAVLYALELFMLFLVFSRIVCETGISFLTFSWQPMQLFTGLLGAEAFGLRNTTLCYWFNGILLQNPRECLMPYVATGFKVADDNGLRLRRVFWFVAGSVALALGIAFLATLYTQYNASGVTDADASYWAVADMTFDRCAAFISGAKDVGRYEAAMSGTFWSRLPLVSPNPAQLRFFVFGMVAVLAFSALRFRFSRFPLHPILFLVWGSYASNTVWWSFLVGGIVKVAVVRFGGGRSYKNLKPLFLGLIAGELGFAGMNVLYNLLYLAIFDLPSTVSIRILPE